MLDWKLRKGALDGQKVLHAGADYQQAARGRDSAQPGSYPSCIVWKKIGVSDCTYYRWRKEYGGLRIEQAKKLKNLEKETARLKKLVADLSLDKAILKEAVEGNF